MRAVFALVLVVGMALAGVAVYMAQGYISQSQSEVAKARAFRDKVGKLVEVYAVNKPLKYGDALTPADVTTIYVQEQFLPLGAWRVTKPKDPAKAGEAVAEADVPAEAPKVDPNVPAGTVAVKDAAGKDVFIAVPEGSLFPENEEKPRFITRTMEPYEILLASRVTEPGEMAGLTGKLDRGMRAFQIKVDVASGVAGFVMPDDHIDIYWTGATEQGEMTRLIESAVKIIAVDQASGEGQSMSDTVARTVTVAVTPEQVARLAQAQATGRLAMSLVADETDVANGMVEVDANSLLGIVEQEVVAVEAAKVCTIKTRKGADVIEIPIPCSN